MQEARVLASTALDIFSLGKVLDFSLTGVHPNSNITFEKFEKSFTLIRRPSFEKKKSSKK